jgi:heme exporter protein CcmD
MPNYWGYVGAGYGLTAAVVGGYAAWLLTRLRRARRSVEPTDGARHG